MKWSNKHLTYLIFSLMLLVLMMSGIVCDLLVPYNPSVSTNESYFCSAQIYRNLSDDEKFTEEWESYTWAKTEGEAITSCQEKLNDYIIYSLAPAFSWYHSDLVVESIVKRKAAECDTSWSGNPMPWTTYGAPLGAEIIWENPGTDEASVEFSITCPENNGFKIRTATPSIASANFHFAERTGLQDISTGTYDRLKHGLLFSNIDVKLMTPFMLGDDITVKQFYIQSLGTVIAEKSVGETYYEVDPYSSKFFVYALANGHDREVTSSFCFVGEAYDLQEYQGAPYAYFIISLDFPSEFSLGGETCTMQVKLNLRKPQAAGFPFETHQPYVVLYDRETTDPLITLTPDHAIDHDDDLQYFLWFANFQAENEIFLGKGETLYDVPFSVGDHEVTVVAYDSKGAFNSSQMNLTVLNVAPSAANDNYSVDEDVVLNIGSPGVLSNDTDANGDILTAVPISDPAHGTLALGSDGSFTYTPNTNWNGTDSFKYAANDGADDSNTAIVTITVKPINDPPAAIDDAYSVDEDNDLNISSPGVLGNDTDVENDTLTANKVSDPANGTLILNSNGSFTYTPTANWYGTDSFKYAANDGTDDSNTAMVTITVEEVPPEEETQNLKDLISPLVNNGELNVGQGNSLKSKLNTAITKLNAGKINTACNLLNAFINEVNALINGGILTPSEGQTLIDKANNIRAEIGC